MPNIAKKLAVEELVRRYQGVRNCLFINFSRVKAVQFAELRDYLRKDQIKVNVLPNAIIRLVFTRLQMPQVKDFIYGPTALVFSFPGGKGDDPTTLARNFLSWRDKNPELKTSLRIQGGIAEGKVVSPDEIINLSRLPSREIILRQLVTTFNNPLSSFVRSLQGIFLKVTCLLKAYAQKIRN